MAKRSRDAHVVDSEHFEAPRQFGFGPNPNSDAMKRRFERFRSLKPIFIVAIETDLHGGFIRLLMKKTKRWAVVPISRLCRAALAECRKKAVLSSYVFIHSNGTRIPEIAVRRAFLRAKRIAGINRRFRFHDLRHTAVCSLASAGVSLQVVQKILGHTSIKMTERYVRVDENAVAEARRALDAKAAALGMSGTGGDSASIES